MLNSICTFFLAWMTLFFVTQKSASVHGTVQDETGQPLSGITLTLSLQLESDPQVSAQTFSTSTNAQGQYRFTGLAAGNYHLLLTHLGYESQEQSLQLREEQHLQLNFSLRQAANQLEDVIVLGQSRTQAAREMAVRAVVVDVAAAAQQPSTLAELINRSTGIRIRQSGGLGNAVDISINGFQGNSVQYFKDGIPLEYLGGGYGLNNVPMNLLERVEVYKGVVPVSLGGDALGGAVNLVTHQQQNAHISASYEAASFNTHIAQLSLYQRWGQNGFIGADAFYNYSDNDYQAEVQVIDEQANPIPVTVPLFHNGYKQHFVEAYAGFRNTSWTDELRFSLAKYRIDRESQHPALMTNPYGALMTHNRGLVPSIRYKKTWMDGTWGLDQFLSYSQINRSRVDTIRGTYDWYGNFMPGSSMGESPRTSLSDVDFDQALVRTNVFYRPTQGHKLEANLVWNLSSRIGSDPYGLRFTGTDIDILSREARYTKNILGLSWESQWLSAKLTNQISAKYFRFSARGINGFMANATDLDQFTQATNHNFGLGNALKYAWAPNQFIRASVELTNRLPREAELFGDSDTRAPNFQLEPERSFNANLGYSYSGDKFRFELGTFYRKTKGMILLVPVQPPFAQYQNLDSIRGYGFDLDLHYRLSKHWNFAGNMTWQDNRMVDIGEGLHQWIEGTRLRNTPYFFANAGLTAHYQGILSGADGFKPYLHWNYIREFYLNHIPRDKEPQGFLGLFGKSGVPVTNLIPDQHLLTAGFNYYLERLPLTLGFEVKNLTDTKLYDYYKIQRPGRSFHLKLNYTLIL